MRSGGDHWGDERRTATIHGYTIFDLLAKYNWERYEFLFSIINVANKKWRAAQIFQPRNSKPKAHGCTIFTLLPANS